MAVITPQSEHDTYLYRSFRLTRVNTAGDLKQKAHPYVSAAVLLGGLVIALVLFAMNRAVEKADSLSSDNALSETLSAEVLQ